MQRWITGIVVSIGACASIAHAQDGWFDPGFATGGHELVDVSPDAVDQGQVMHIQPDGKLLMAGTCLKSETISGVTSLFPKFCATRLRADGHYDTNFGPGGVGYIRFDRFETPTINFPHNSSLSDMVRLNDGRILFMGRQTDPGLFMAVLTPNGSALDPTVGDGAGFITSQFGTVSSVGAALLVQADGKILVAGETTGPNGNADMAIKRFLPDLTVDTSFGDAGYQTVAFDLGGPSGDNTDAATRIALQADGRILLAGNAVVSTTPPRVELAFARLLPNGQPDPDFGPDHDGRAHFALDGYNFGAAIRIDRHSRINFAGTTVNTTTGSYLCVVNRLLTDGRQDPSFNPADGAGHPQLFTVSYGGSEHSCALADLDVRADGSIFTVGEAYRSAPGGASYFAVAELTPTGFLDSSFGIGGMSYGGFAQVADSNDVATSIAVGNGGLMIAGYSTDAAGTDTRFGIGRLVLDTIFVDGFDD